MPTEIAPARADAFKVPRSFVAGADSPGARVQKIADRCADALGVPRRGAKSPVIRRWMDGSYLVFPDHRQVIQFPMGHPRYGEERYAWAGPDADGVQAGTLVEGAADAVSVIQ